MPTENFTDSLTLLPAATEHSRGTVVLFHGLTASPGEVEGLATFLHERGFAVVAPKLTGHGTSVEELRRVPAAAWLADAEAALVQAEKLGSGPIVVAGVSFGGLLALYLAGAKLQVVRAVVVASVPIHFRSALREVLLTMLSYLPDVMLNYLGIKNKKRRDSSHFLLPRASYAQHSIAAAARLVKIRRIVCKRLSAITAPVLALYDPLDHHVASDAADELAKLATRSDVEVVAIENGQHELFVGPSYKDVYREISKFLDKVCNDAA